MENILIGLIKSDHNVKFKKAMIEKLIASKSEPSPHYQLPDLINEIESLWSIGQDAELNVKKCCPTASLFESFSMHYDLVKCALAYFIGRDLATQNIQDLMTHLTNLIKMSFMPNLNRENNYKMIRQNFLVLIKWLRMLNETFMASLKDFEICSNFVNILSTLNSNLLYYPDKASSLQFLYFIQNDSVFCREYLNLTKSFFILNDKYNSTVSESADLDQLKKFDKIIQFLERTVLDTNILLMRHVIARKITLQATEEASSQPKNDSYDLRPNLKVELENLCEIVKTIGSFVNKSFTLYESTVKELLNFLCNISENSDQGPGDEDNSCCRIDKKLAQLFQIFDLTKILPILYKYFEENKSILLLEEFNKYLRNLLFNLIQMVSWPFNLKIDEWICCIMTMLANRYQKYRLLISVKKIIVKKVFNLISTNSNESALNVFAFFLINYQHSAKLFHKMCSKLCNLLENLKEKKSHKNESGENQFQNDRAATTYNHLALLTFICITKFGGYPQLYKPLLDIIQNDTDLANFDTFKDKYSLQKISSILKILPSDTSNVASKFEPSNHTIGKEETENDDTQPIKKLAPNLTGLVNLGNTCYLNSIIQAMFSCKKFVKTLVETEVHQLNEPSNDFSYLNQLKILFSIMLLTQRPAIKATNFVKHCTPSWFRWGQQQDSSEFLIFLLDNLDEQLKKFDANILNLVKKSFGIQVRTECKCSNCLTITSRDDVCFYLPLSFSQSSGSKVIATPSSTSSHSDSAVPPSSSHTEVTESHTKTSLKSLINNFFEVENLSSETGNSYFCTSCNSLQTASKQLVMVRDDEKNIHPPDYLIFTLNRFIYQANNGTVAANLKIMEQVDYPTQIEINTYDVATSRLVVESYSLLAIVVHSGSSLHYGHYYTYMVCNQIDMNENADNWYLANDSHITKVSFESLTSNQNLFKDDTPYLLFYTKIAHKSSTVIASDSKDNHSSNDLVIQVPNKKLIEIIDQDNKVFQTEEKNRLLRTKKNPQNDDRYAALSKSYYSSRDDDDDSSSSGGGGGGANQPPSYCSNDSQRDSGPRIVF